MVKYRLEQITMRINIADQKEQYVGVFFDEG